MSKLLHSNPDGPSGPQKSDTLLRFVLLIAASTLAVLYSACEKKDTSVIDSLGSPPFIVAASLSPSIVNLDTIPQSIAYVQLSVNARIMHQNGSSGISQVSYSLSDETASQSLAVGQLFDNGTPPDLRAGDSVFTAQISLPVQSLPVGKYFCQIVAQSQHGYTSSTLLLPLIIGRQLNHPPILSNLQAPDTIILGGQSQQFKVMVKATDPDGQSDMAKVFFHSYKPDGTATNGGNPFLMYDDGSDKILFPPDLTSGDAVKGNSIYTLTVIVDTSNAKGSYRFEFLAQDRSNAFSQKLTKNILVLQ